MNCPNCGKSNAEGACFCIFCGNPLATNSIASDSTPRFKGSLSSSLSSDGVKKKPADTEPDRRSVKGSTPTLRRESEKERASEDEMRTVKASGLKSTMGKPRPTKSAEAGESTYTYCKKCGRRLRAGEKCPDCYAVGHMTGETGRVEANKSSKTWLILASIAAIVILVIGIASAIPKKSSGAISSLSSNESWPDAGYSSNNNSQNQERAAQNNRLSSSCDYVLCAGYDKSGNEYELVANQTESSHGFEITVGVIKNNSWLYPLSSDFPFLGEDGLFHVSVSVSFIGDDADSGTSLLHPNRVIDKLYFIDSGAFLLECYRESQELFGRSESYYLLFSCNTLTSIRIDRSKTNVLFRYSEPTFLSGQVESYGQIHTDNGRIILYEETSGTSSGWTEDQVFSWDILDTRTLITTTIASNIKGVRPRSVLAEGVFFCTDGQFYNINAQPTIDLTDYGIDIWDSGDILFDGGTCTFEVENSLGTRFLITVDSSGALISEQPA